MTPLQSLLDTFRKASQSEREKGNYFEELIRTYFRYEARFEELYSDVWLYSDWAKENELDAKDTGIDLVAKTAGTEEFHAIQCKFWCFNSSRKGVEENMARMIEFYNSEVRRFGDADLKFDASERLLGIDTFISNNPKEISWTRALKNDFGKGREFEFDSERMTQSVYRPFSKRWLYFDRSFNEMVYQMFRIFPDTTSENRMIMVKQRWSGDGHLALMVDRIPELQTDGGTQCFPLYLYDDKKSGGDTDDLFDAAPGAARRRDAITDEGLAHFQSAYPGEALTKEDLFYYIYGLLHSPDYRARYADNLGKELPRIPAVKTFADFQAFSQAGRELAHWHLDYETVAIDPTAKLDTGKRAPNSLTASDYRVTKMKFGKKQDPETGANVADRSVVIYNGAITIRDIPLEAYDYVVNGKPALAWVMERQAVTTDKKSGIVNDANLWATETMNNAKYPLELFQRVITVSLETMKIVKGLPELDID